MKKTQKEVEERNVGGPRLGVASPRRQVQRGASEHVVPVHARAHPLHEPLERPLLPAQRASHHRRPLVVLWVAPVHLRNRGRSGCATSRGCGIQRSTTFCPSHRTCWSTHKDTSSTGTCSSSFRLMVLNKSCAASRLPSAALSHLHRGNGRGGGSDARSGNFNQINEAA
jgi:hypothetical protein